MKKVYYVFIVLNCILASCGTDYGFIDTGVSETHENETMYEYFQTDLYNWTLVKRMIDKAGLKAMFNGEDPNYKEIMFLGPVDNSMRAWMWDNRYQTVEDMDAELCKKLILRYVFNTVYEREKVPVKLSETGDGGVNLTGLAGNLVWFYSMKEPFLDNPNVMITSLELLMKDNGQKAYIASSGIKVKNGMVHSLDDSHKIGNIN
ncbi:hypothetical protein [Butyricimonas faecihominis]|jgi:hypothetical protein